MRKSGLAVMLGAVALSPLSSGGARAQGCGPMRLKVAESVTLDMAPDALWRLVGNFQDMSWDNDTKALSGSGGNIPDTALRTLTLRNGKVLAESLYKYDAAAMSYSYHIDKLDTDMLPVQNASLTIEVEPADGGAKSTLRWRAAFYRFLKPGEPAPDVADANAAKALRALLNQGLAGLRARGEPKT